MAQSSARALALVLLAAVFLRAGFAPISTLDSWADWKYGQWIWEHRQLPKQEPFSSYSDPKTPVHDGNWLAEVIYYLAVSRAGLEGVALLHALLETAKAALFLLAVRRLTGSLGLAIAMTALMEALCWPYFGTIRTTVPAEVCWAGLLLVCSARVPSRIDVVAAPLIVALWANLGATFGFALVLLGDLLIGRFFEETRNRRRLSLALRDSGVKRLALLLGLSLAAACCNPYGTARFLDAFGSSNLVLEARLWPKLIPVHLWESRVLIISALLVLIVLRLSPRPFTLSEVTQTAIFGVWAWYDKPNAPWWLMLAPWVLAPHFKAICDRFIVSRSEQASAKPQAAFLLLGVAAVLVLLSPTARWAIGRPIPPEQRIGSMEPYHLTARLTESASPAARHVLTLPYWWGDYLLWELPQGDQVFWYSRPESLIRPKPGKPHLPTLSALAAHDPTPAEWNALIENYHFDTVVIRPEAWEGFQAYLAQRPPDEWTVILDNSAPDSVGGGPASRGFVVVRRNNP